MEIKMNKDIREYKESIFFGLSMRQTFFFCLVLLGSGGMLLCFKALSGGGAYQLGLHPGGLALRCTWLYHV